MEQAVDLLHHNCLNVIPINVVKIKKNIVYYNNKTFYNSRCEESRYILYFIL
jgi:hypothetical protein